MYPCAEHEHPYRHDHNSLKHGQHQVSGDFAGKVLPDGQRSNQQTLQDGVVAVSADPYRDGDDRVGHDGHADEAHQHHVEIGDLDGLHLFSVQQEGQVGAQAGRLGFRHQVADYPLHQLVALRVPVVLQQGNRDGTPCLRTRSAEALGDNNKVVPLASLNPQPGLRSGNVFLLKLQKVYSL